LDVIFLLGLAHFWRIYNYEFFTSIYKTISYRLVKLYLVICMQCIIYIGHNVGKVHGLFGDMLIEYWDNHH
jgi:hypothetical protein